MNIPNWTHNSGKPKKTKGSPRAYIKARKQELQALKRKYGLL